MVEKQDCPFCGKVSIDGRHIRLCPKKPQDNPEIPSVVETVELVAGIVSTPILETSEPIKYVECPYCRDREAIPLNSLDIRCPKCGDVQIKASVPVRL